MFYSLWCIKLLKFYNKNSDNPVKIGQMILIEMYVRRCENANKHTKDAQYHWSGGK
jgi:hypothetical protein